MMNFQSLIFLLSLSQVIYSAPIVVTRVHTAEAVTVTDTYTTVTNVHTAPTVQILVSDGVSYTSTLTDATFAEPTTFTSAFINKNADAATTDAATEAQPTTEAEAEVEIPDAATTAVTTTLIGTTEANTQAATTEANTQAATTEEADNNDNTEHTTAELVPTVAVSYVGTTSATTTPTTTHQAPTAIQTSIATSKNQETSRATSSSTSTSTSTSTASKLTSKPTAIVYSPYNDDNSCKDYNTVLNDLTYIKSLGVGKIRVYGTDCNSIENVETVALNLGIKINQGFWIGSSGADSIDDGVDAIISWATTNGWDVFDFFTIGNEAVQFNYVTVDELLAKISSVSEKLRAAGYTGQITTSEPPHIFVNNPALCTSGVIDFVGANPHSYFDPYSTAESAGSFVRGQLDLVKEACGDIDILVTETGYPSAGVQNGGNIPSKANQIIAVQAILDELNCEATILSTFNDYWKDPGSYGIEQSFGIWDILE